MRAEGLGELSTYHISEGLGRTILIAGTYPTVRAEGLGELSTYHISEGLGRTILIAGTYCASWGARWAFNIYFRGVGSNHSYSWYLLCELRGWVSFQHILQRGWVEPFCRYDFCLFLLCWGMYRACFVHSSRVLACFMLGWHTSVKETATNLKLETLANISDKRFGCPAITTEAFN